MKLEDLNNSVNSYYARLFKQALRKSTVHKSIVPVRDASFVVAYKTVEKNATSLTIPKDMRPLNSVLLTSTIMFPLM